MSTNNFPLPFTPFKGQKLTLIVISDWMAHTMRTEIEITGEHNNRTTFKQRGKRKEFYLKLDITDSIVLEGWDLPIKVDSDSQSSFTGNACHNLVAENPDQLKELLSKSLIPLTDDTKSKVFFISMEKFKAGNTHPDGLLYPELDSSNSAIQSFKETYPQPVVG